jgi:hypothetical protein
MKKQYILTLLLASLFVVVSLHTVTAQTSIADICGQNAADPKCTLQDAKTIVGNLLTRFIIPIGSAILVVIIMYRIIASWFIARREGNPNAIKIAASQAGNAILGFILVIAIMGGLFLGLLKFIGTQDWAIPLVKLLSNAFIPHAYAQSGYLPNPLGVSNLYDFLLLLVRLVVRWFIYPAIIVMWVWSGFAYVEAQGNPEKLSKAHNWLLWAVISTVVVLMTEGFLFALRGTVQQILS